MVDIFERLEKNAGGPIGQYMAYAHGYFAFPKLEGEIGPHMTFRGKKVLNWSLNNYLGLANHPEVRKADADGAAEFGMAAPMGARMMSGQTKYHEQLERELAEFVGKEDAFLLNFGYQGMISIIDCLLTPRDVVVYDAEAHACIIDGLRMHKGKRFVFGHNDMESLRLQLGHATELAESQNGGVLVITEGVFGMKGDLGKLNEIVALKKEFRFRLLVDDAHGFGTMGPQGRGTAAHFGVVGEELPLMKAKMERALREGRPIICVVGPGDFTTSGHFIVITGMRDGKFTVNDPNSTERSGMLWDYETLEPQISNLWAFHAV